MNTEKESNVTVFLKAWSGGDREAADTLMALVYKEMRKLAASYLKRQHPGHTLQPTALVHEAYMKLIDVSQANWQDRAHFFAAAAQTMRNILVDHARTVGSQKRGGDLQRIQIDDVDIVSKGSEIDLADLDDALNDLARQDKVQSQIIELRFFGGLTIEEAAEVLKISPATVKREWSMARAWLFRRLSDRAV